MPVLSWPLDAKRRKQGRNTSTVTHRRCQPSSTTAETAHEQPGPDPANMHTKSTEAAKAARKPVPDLTDTYLIPARLTRPSEPILLPKLRIQFADFPYLHCSIARGCSPWRPAADMGTACHENYIALLGFSRFDESVPDTTRGVVLYGGWSPISGQSDSRG